MNVNLMRPTDPDRKMQLPDHLVYFKLVMKINNYLIDSNCYKIYIFIVTLMHHSVNDLPYFFLNLKSC